MDVVAFIRTRIEALETLVKRALASGSAAAAALGAPDLVARNVITVALPAYTYVAGVITGNANGSMGAQDGVANAAGDLVFLPGGIAVAPLEQGLYTVIRPGSAGTTFQLERVGGMAEGSILPSGTQVRMGGEGATFQNTVWAAMLVAEFFTVGVTDSEFYPRETTVRVTLVNGTININGVPVLSASSGVAISRALFDTGAATVMYAPTSAGADGITPGYLGTANTVVQGVIAEGTINAADLSQLHVTIFNGQR